MKAEAVAVLLTLGLAGCMGGSTAACTLPDGTTGSDGPYAILHTDWGDIVVELFAEEAPQTVENFLQLAHNGTYDGTLFWRMENDFVMQGGDPTNQGDGGWSSTGDPIPDEETPERSHDRRGILSMANRGPDTGRSQFFITFAPAPSLDLVINENEHRGHTIFGQVVEGMDILAGINYNAAGPRSGPDRGVPYFDVTLIDVTTLCEDPRPMARANLMTPNVWDLRSDTETVAAWVRGHDQQVPWAITGPDGAPLSDGWRLTWTPLAMGELPDGWGMALLALNLPEDAAPGIQDAQLHAGDAVQPIQLRVHEDRGNVSKAGDKVTIRYGMRDATLVHEIPLDQPTIEVTVGTPGAVPGFAWGLTGLARGETAVLHVPSGVAYGSGLAEDDPFKRFDGKDLDYNVVVLDVRPLGS